MILQFELEKLLICISYHLAFYNWQESFVMQNIFLLSLCGPYIFQKPPPAIAVLKMHFDSIICIFIPYSQKSDIGISMNRQIRRHDKRS